jgi:hypothetical protein
MHDLQDSDFVIPDSLLDCHYVWRILACDLIIVGESRRIEALNKMDSRMRQSMEAEIGELRRQAKLLGVDSQALAMALRDKLLDLGVSAAEPPTLH